MTAASPTESSHLLSVLIFSPLAAAAVAALIAPDMGWDEQEAADQAARFIESCQKELLTAGLDLP